MELLEINQDLAALPITDVSHVLRTINIHRKAIGAIKAYYKEKICRQQRYKYTKK